MQDFTGWTDEELENAVANAARDAEAIAQRLLTMPTWTAEYAKAKTTYEGRHRLVKDGTAELLHRLDAATPYAKACARHLAAAEGVTAAGEMVKLAAVLSDLANAEFAAASRELAKYETSPGVPKPEYDTATGEAGQS